MNKKDRHQRGGRGRIALRWASPYLIIRLQYNEIDPRGCQGLSVTEENPPAEIRGITPRADGVALEATPWAWCGAAHEIVQAQRSRLVLRRQGLLRRRCLH